MNRGHGAMRSPSGVPAGSIMPMVHPNPIPILSAALCLPGLARLDPPLSQETSSEAGPTVPDEPTWRSALTWLKGERDRLAKNLETAHALLLERAQRGHPDLVARLEPSPPRPMPTGYGVLPRLGENDPLATAQPRERSYSLERVSTSFVGEMRDAAMLASHAVGNGQANLEAQVTEFERLKKRLRKLEEHMSYHEWWQRAVIDDARYFAERNEVVATTRDWRRWVATGEDPERAQRMERDIIERVAPFRPTNGLAIETATDGARTLTVEVHTDVTDEVFLAAMTAGIDAAWNDAPAMRAARLRVELTLVRHAGADLYPEGVPAHAESIDAADHLARFPANTLVITTGATSTHARVGRYVLLGPAKVTPRTLAHEFGHLLGFSDAYLRGYDGQPDDRFGVVLVEWSGLLDDLMGDSRGGCVSEGMTDRLLGAYGAP